MGDAEQIIRSQATVGRGLKCRDWPRGRDGAKSSYTSKYSAFWKVLFHLSLKQTLIAMMYRRKED